jgi:hypothetical protein
MDKGCGTPAPSQFSRFDIYARIAKKCALIGVDSCGGRSRIWLAARILVKDRRVAQIGEDSACLQQ